MCIMCMYLVYNSFLDHFHVPIISTIKNCGEFFFSKYIDTMTFDSVGEDSEDVAIPSMAELLRRLAAQGRKFMSCSHCQELCQAAAPNLLHKG